MIGSFAGVYRLALPVVLLPSLFFLLAFGLPYFVVRWNERPLFMSGCTMGRLDDDTLRRCNVGYDRYRAVMANNWRPLEGGAK